MNRTEINLAQQLCSPPPADHKTIRIRQLLRDGKLTYRQLLDIGDRINQFSFTNEEVKEVRRQQVTARQRCSYNGYNSFVIYSRTDGQD